MDKLVIPHLFREVVSRIGDHNALGKKDPLTNSYTYITFKETEKRIDCLASALLELGVKPADKIAIISENCPEWVISDLAIIGISALDVPIYTTLTYLQIEYILNNSGVKGIIVSNDTHYQKIVKNFETVPSLEFVIYINEVKKAEHPRVKSLSFQEVLDLGQATLDKNRNIINDRLENIKEDDVCRYNLYLRYYRRSQRGYAYPQKLCQ
jgi:long-chain acyl-CoA synthetase